MLYITIRFTNCFLSCSQVMWFRMGANGSILDRDSHQVDSLFTNYIIEDLLPVTNYSVTIYAINGRGRGKGSDEQDILTFPSGEKT